jgi:hypothetical protein
MDESEKYVKGGLLFMTSVLGALGYWHYRRSTKHQETKSYLDGQKLLPPDAHVFRKISHFKRPLLITGLAKHMFDDPGRAS